MTDNTNVDDRGDMKELKQSNRRMRWLVWIVLATGIVQACDFILSIWS